MSSEWCQNKNCPNKKNSNQIRGSKYNKWYQSNKAQGYGGGNFCTLGCYDHWADNYMSQAIDSLGVRINEPVKLFLEDAWYVEYNYGYSRSDAMYYLRNKNRGIRQSITREQAQTPEQRAEEYGYWGTIEDYQAKELAITLGLVS